jgi:hypothetical protein
VQLVQQSILAARTVLVVDQHPVEAGQTGDLDRHRRTEIQERAGEPLAREHAAAKIRGKFHGAGRRGARRS